MTKRTVTIAIVLAALGGCTSLGNGGVSQLADANHDLSGYFVDRLATGRQYLDADQPGRAITAFRQASYDPALAGEAFNGMGVAYMMQGRPDVGRQMFERAVRAVPADPRFARNLSRLNDRDETVIRSAGVENDAAAPGSQMPLSASAAPPADFARSDDVRVPGRVTADGLTHRSVKEAHIARTRNRRGVETSSVAGQTSSLAHGSVGANRASITVFKPQRIYPVRVAIAGQAETGRAIRRHRSSTRPAPAYPLRIALLARGPGTGRN